MFEHLNEVLTKWEGLWLFVVLIAGLCIEFHSNYMLRKEYEYDEQKDILRKQKRVRVTKKVTKNKDGSTVEENTEETTTGGTDETGQQPKP
jgi:hypothetical protein